MEEVLNFIQANYVWFIIGIVVLTMTIVGYFAEKTGFSFTEKGKPKSKNSEIDEEVNDLNKETKEEGIADMIKENNEEISIPTYTEETVETNEEVPTQDINIPEQAEERINLEASDEDLYKPLSTTEEEPAQDIPDELYAPIDCPPSTDNAEDSNITLENVTPFSIDEEDSNEQVEDENSEYSRLFPSDPIIIDGENKEEPQEEVAQEDIWNV